MDSFFQTDDKAFKLGESELDRLMNGELLTLDMDLDAVITQDLDLTAATSLYNELENRDLKIEMDSAMDHMDSDYSFESPRSVGKKNKRNMFEHEKSPAHKSNIEIKVESGSKARSSISAKRKGKNLQDMEIRAVKGEPSKIGTARDVDLLDENYRHLKTLNEQNACLNFNNEPPLEVRTRTKNENRTFACSLSLDLHDLLSQGISEREGCSCCTISASVKLVYAKDVNTLLPILGGTCKQQIHVPTSRCAIHSKNQNKAQGIVDIEFNDLSVSVASPKHSEREFSLCVQIDSLSIPSVPGMVKLEPDMLDSLQRPVYSRPFYAYSHKSVLRRRREVSIRAASHASCASTGGVSMHVVGSPFVRSDRLQCVFRIKSEHYRKYIKHADSDQNDILSHEDSGEWTSLRAVNLEHFSDSVLFFETPTELGESISEDIPAFIQITNDGRNFSNPLPFTFTKIDHSSSQPNKRPRIMSRM